MKLGSRVASFLRWGPVVDGQILETVQSRDTDLVEEEYVNECQNYDNFQLTIADAWEPEFDDDYFNVTPTTRNDQRGEKFLTVDIDELRELSWHGIPVSVRAATWRLLSGYIPTDLYQRKLVLKAKQEEYWNMANECYKIRHEAKHAGTYRQIQVDIPRTRPTALFKQPVVQEMFQHVLYLWAVQHPEPGYVQGMNDLVVPFFVVFLQELLGEGCDPTSIDVGLLAEEDRRHIEADTFWCFSKLLETIQYNYVINQPGIISSICHFEKLIQRVDVELHQHLKKHGVEYLQFVFRWMNNLLFRELPLECSIRLWDSYLSQVNGFNDLHVYVCAAFLLEWRASLVRHDNFQDLLTMLLNLPTQQWSNKEVEDVIANAFLLHCSSSPSPQLLNDSNTS